MPRFDRTSLPLPETFESFDEEQRAAILRNWIDAQNCLAVDPKFFSVDTTTEVFVRPGGQTFLLFGGRAYEPLCQRATEIHPDGTRTTWEYLPARNPAGQFFALWPDEGTGGVYHLMRCLEQQGQPPRFGGWLCTHIQVGWLRREELALSAREIHEKIVDEVMRGETPLTGLSSRPEYQ